MITIIKIEERRRLVRELLNEKKYKMQSEIIKAIREKGYEVKQSDISKDFKALGVTKDANGYLYAAENAKDKSLIDDLSGFYRLASADNNLVEMKICTLNTKRGHSQLLAHKIKIYNAECGKYNIKLLPLDDALIIFYDNDIFIDRLRIALGIS